MSPEQAAGEPIDPRSDLYGVGVLLYRMATGIVPFEADSLRELLIAHMARAPIPPSQILPGIHPALERVILKALGKSPVERFQTAREFRAAIERADELRGSGSNEAAKSKTQSAPFSANPRVQRLIDRFASLLAKGHYEYLQVPRSAEVSTIRQTARRLASELCLEALGPMSPEESRKVAIIRERLSHSLSVLASPKSRAEYDARIGNYLGVAQALASGLKTDEADALRRTHLAKNPNAERVAIAALHEALAGERMGHIDDARCALERALSADPLDVMLHHRYWAIRRRMDGVSRPTTTATPRPLRRANSHVP
jgi:serine/threonine protein kinase